MYTRLMHVLVAAAVGSFAGMSGCHSAPKTVDYARPYPADALAMRTVNIQVVRQGTEIELTNTTAHSFGPCTLWLNERFSRPLDGFKIGQTLRLNLREFRDQYSDPFRAGGFFATDLPDEVVKAELEVPGGLPGWPNVEPGAGAGAGTGADAAVTANPEQPHGTLWLGLIPIGQEKE